MTQDYDIFKLGDWELQSGEKIPDAQLAYKTVGDPKLPAIVYPTWFSGGVHLLVMTKETVRLITG